MYELIALKEREPEEKEGKMRGGQRLE